MGGSVCRPRFHALFITQIEPHTHYNSVRHTPFVATLETMNSEERKAARRARREAQREKKRLEAVSRYDDYDRVISANSLIKAAKQCRKGVAWKASVQRYMMSLLRNTWELRNKLKQGISVVQGFICFTINERGKTRNIRSVHFRERVIQRSLCDNALVPVLSRSLVYDNGATLKGKGIHFALRRCKQHLRRYYCENGFSNDGWVLLIDFSGYFDNIQHPPIKELLLKSFKNRRLLWLTWRFVKSFGDKSLGIGSQVSQILALVYPNAVDHYAREVLRLSISGRYMDDSYYIHHDRQYLEECLEKLKVKFDALGIKLNPRKTQIIPVKRFTFIKVRFYLTAQGKVVMKPCKDSYVRERRKLKAFRRFVDQGRMTLDDVRCSYESWRGYQQYLDSKRSIREMDKLYFDLFGLRPSTKKKKGAKTK